MNTVMCERCERFVTEEHLNGRCGWGVAAAVEAEIPAQHEFPQETLATAVKDMLDYMEERGYSAPTYHVLCVRQALERANG